MADPTLVFDESDNRDTLLAKVRADPNDKRRRAALELVGEEDIGCVPLTETDFVAPQRMEYDRPEAPTVYVVIGSSAFTQTGPFDAVGDIIEAELVDGVPAWDSATVCDPARSEGGRIGFASLVRAIREAEQLATDLDTPMVRLLR